MKTIFWLFLIGIPALICFAIYYLFKILEFTLRAINLYEKMVNRQDVMIKLLTDIKSEGNFKKVDVSERNMCAETVKLEAKKHCGHEIKQIDESSNTFVPTPSDEELVSGFKTELSKFGYKLTGSNEKWIIKPPNGTLTMYVYSLEDLIRKVKSIVKENKEITG